MRVHIRILFVATAIMLMVAAAVSAQEDTIILLTPTAAPTATVVPDIDAGPGSPLNPQAGDLPSLGPSASINVNGLDGYIVTESAGPIFMREGDSTAYRPVAVITGGVSVEATGTNEEQTWWRVRTANNRFEGWINAELLILRGDLTNVPVIPDSDKGTILVPTFATFTTQRLYRTATDLSAAVLCRIPAGEYRVLSIDENGEYYRIRATCLNGSTVTGYISTELGAFRSSSGVAVPIVAAPEFIPPPPAPVIASTAVPSTANTSAAVNAAISATLASSSAVSVPGVGPSLLTFQSQVVYDEPFIRPSAVVCSVPEGLYTVIGRANDSDFYLINATCTDGRNVDVWIPIEAGAFQNDTELRVPIAVTATPIGFTTITVPAGAARFVTFLTQPVTTAPADDARIVCSIPAAEHQITGRTSDGTFFRVRTLCTDGSQVTGWIDGELGAFRNPQLVEVPVIDE